MNLRCLLESRGSESALYATAWPFAESSMRPLLRFVLALCCLASLHAAESSPQIHLIGDSTMADKKPNEEPERGWGMALPSFCRDPKIVHNHAVNGRSTKSFIDEGRWEKVRSELQPGDFVIIQFGHNDEKKEDPKRFTDPATTYSENLRLFVRETREKGANPILATPVARRTFNAEGKLVDTHGAYPDAVRAVAKSEHVPLLDLQRNTADWLQKAGDEPSKQFFVWVPAGKYPNRRDGSKDNTHFVEAGAHHVAELAVAEMQRQNLPIAKLLK
jgi:DNA sulfur modification protein DndE